MTISEKFHYSNWWKKRNKTEQKINLYKCLNWPVSLIILLEESSKRNVYVWWVVQVGRRTSLSFFFWHDFGDEILLILKNWWQKDSEKNLVSYVWICLRYMKFILYEYEYEMKFILTSFLFWNHNTFFFNTSKANVINIVFIYLILYPFHSISSEMALSTIKWPI